MFAILDVTTDALSCLPRLEVDKCRLLSQSAGICLDQSWASLPRHILNRLDVIQNATCRRRRNNVAVVVELNISDGTQTEFKLDLPHLDAVAESLSSLRGAHVRSLWLNCRVEDFMQSYLQYAFRKLQILVESAMLEPPAKAMLTVSSREVATMLGGALEAIGTKNLQLSLCYADSAIKLPLLGGVDFLELQKPTLPASSADILSLIFSGRVPRVSLQLAVTEQSPASATARFADTVLRELRIRTNVSVFPRLLLVECLDSACAKLAWASVRAMAATTMYAGFVSVRQADGLVDRQNVFYLEKEHGCVTFLAFRPAGKVRGTVLQLLFIKERLLPDASGEIVLKGAYSPRALPFRED